MSKEVFTFTPENFVDPKLPHGLATVDVAVNLATDESLKGYGYLVRSQDEFTTEKKNFEIKQWPKPGWRELDPGTGDEAGTTEGNFNVKWNGDYYYAKNLAINTLNNSYLDGLGAMPESAVHDDQGATASDPGHIYLWMSDYHPDGAQMFWPLTPEPVAFTVCLGLSSFGDDIKPTDMRAFYIPAGYGLYIHPGTWHNGVYVTKQVAPSSAPATFLTRQGRVHGRISASWAVEFKTLLKVSLAPPS